MVQKYLKMEEDCKLYAPRIFGRDLLSEKLMLQLIDYFEEIVPLFECPSLVSINNGVQYDSKKF